MKLLVKVLCFLILILLSLTIFAPAVAANNQRAYIYMSADTKSDFYVDGIKLPYPADTVMYTCLADSSKPDRTFKAVPVDQKIAKTQEKKVFIEHWGDFSPAECNENPKTDVTFTLLNPTPTPPSTPTPSTSPGNAATTTGGGPCANVDTEFGTVCTFGQYISLILKKVEPVIAALAVLMAVYIGILYMLGTQESMGQAKELIFGLIFAIGLFFLMQLILRILGIV